MPRVSTSKHPVAVLRRELDLHQKEFADIVGCSLPTVQSIELGRLELSTKLAARISERTGVSMEWLMGGKAKEPIPAAESRGYCFVEFSKRHFDLAQSRNLSMIKEIDFEFLLEMGSAELKSVFRMARKRGAEEAKICFHLISKGLDDLKDQLEAEFGKDLDFLGASYEAMKVKYLGKPEFAEEENPPIELFSEEEIEERFESFPVKG